MDIRGNKSDTDSPCEGECTITRGGAQCLKCKRTRKEVDHWNELSDDQKREINEDLKTRTLSVNSGYADS